MAFSLAWNINGLKGPAVHLWLWFTHFLMFRKSCAAKNAKLRLKVTTFYFILCKNAIPAYSLFIHVGAHLWEEMKPLYCCLTPTLWQMQKSQLAHHAKYLPALTSSSGFTQLCILASMYLLCRKCCAKLHSHTACWSVSSKLPFVFKEGDDYCVLFESRNFMQGFKQTIQKQGCGV